MHHLDSSIWAPEFVSCARQSVRKVVAQLKQDTPGLSKYVLQWLSLRCDLEQLEEYFLLPGALTLLSLPWWLEQSLRGSVDVEFQSRLMESSTNLYYFARMLDDLMDEHEIEKAALPAMYHFLLDFQKAFLDYFPASNSFWIHFRRYTAEIAEVTSTDLSLSEIDERAFTDITARKSIAALAPVAAVCCRYGREDLLEAWESYFRTFECWHQFRDDLLDWSDDVARGAKTWLLSEAEWRRRPEETVAMWMGREGFAWAGSQLARWMAEMKLKAAALNSPELLRYLDLREKTCTAEVEYFKRSAAVWTQMLEHAFLNG